jgi:GNAT superfamily N-acetyltransferase
MPLREESARGADYLALATTLLHRVRLAEPTAGMWEAADFQWWWRRRRASDYYGQLFWLDSQREPAAGVILTHDAQSGACQLDVIITPEHVDSLFGGVWQRALARRTELELDTVEATVRDDDTAMLEAVAAAGFTATGETGASSWLSCADRVTGVGLVEPMRTEDRYWRKGLARHILTTGLNLLAARGCARLKVSSGRDLYLGAGFTPVVRDRTYLSRAT